MKYLRGVLIVGGSPMAARWEDTAWEDKGGDEPHYFVGDYFVYHGLARVTGDGAYIDCLGRRYRVLWRDDAALGYIGAPAGGWRQLPAWAHHLHLRLAWTRDIWRDGLRQAWASTRHVWG